MVSEIVTTVSALVVRHEIQNDFSMRTNSEVHVSHLLINLFYATIQLLEHLSVVDVGISYYFLKIFRDISCARDVYACLHTFCS